MKRKTNLFYLSGDDSNFITFSNYGESLTGNYLATDWKLYPTKFLCIYCKYLDSDNYEEHKRRLINHLAAHYENKLAFLRDKYIEGNLNVEEQMFPLNYLLEILYRIQSDSTGKIILKEDLPETGNNEDLYISFIGNITEQDYNGTYSDIISFIDSTAKPMGNIIIDNTIDYTIPFEYTEQTEHLYGWVNNNRYIGPSEYTETPPIFDNPTENGYYSNSKIVGLNLYEHAVGEGLSSNNIKFNMIIPLYDLINNNINTTNTLLDIEENNIIALNIEDETYVRNVPLGIWFCEEPIELKRDNRTQYAPSWSLLLSAQFKPFPYSRKLPNEITQDATKDAFATYAQILTRQNRLLTLLSDLETTVSQLDNKITNINAKLDTLGTSYTVDSIKREMIDFEQYQQENFKNFKSEIYSYISNTWKGYLS